MANRLKKLAQAQYTPSSPYQPGSPAYCVTTVVGYQSKSGLSGYDAGLVDGNGVTTGFGSVSPGQVRDALSDLASGGFAGVMLNTESGNDELVPITRRVCYPAVAAIPAEPAKLTYTAIDGWNGGARSITPLVGDGAFTFEVGPAAIGVVVGLVGADESTSPAEPSHAFYVHQGVVAVMESGVVVATAPTPHSAGKRLAISRSLGQVTYLYDGWAYTSAVVSQGAAYLDATIYASGDYVDNPQLVAALVQSGEIRATLPPLVGLLTDRASYAFGGGRLPPLGGLASGISGGLGRIEGSLPALGGHAADHAYSEVRGTLPVLAGALNGGFPQVSRATVVGILPPLSGLLRGLTGSVGRIEAALPPLLGLGADHAYAEVRGTLPALSGAGLTFAPTDYGNARDSFLVVADLWVASCRQSAVLSEQLGLSSGFTLGVVIDGTLFEALAISSEVSAYRALSAVIQSGLLLGGTADAGMAASVQYAVNVLTGALTTYSGFDFDAFALADNTLYACRPDGLYRMRPGDDDGSPIAVTLDFGATDYGAVQAKTVQEVFLGMTTDGEVIVTLRADGVDRRYRAVARGPMMRAAPARGVSARRWNLTLEVTDATEFELDTIEHIVAVAARRGMR